MEECAEIQKSAAKALRFGLDDHASNSESTNAEDISMEIIDLLAVAEMLKDKGIIPNIGPQESEVLITRKKDKVEKYMSYAEGRGTLTNKY